MSFHNPIVLDDDDNNNNNINNNSNVCTGMRASDGTILYPAFSFNQHVVVQVGAQFLHATVEAIELKSSTSPENNNNSNNNNNNNSTLSSQSLTQNPHHQQKHDTFYYYVHFADQDRRMDLWVEGDVLRNATNNGLRNSSKLSATAAAKVGKQTATRTRRQLQLLEQQNNNNGNPLLTANSSANSSRAQSVATSNASISVVDPATSLTASQQQLQTHYQPTTAKNYARNHQHSNADSKFFDRPKNVAKFIIGDVEVDSWYFSPYLLAHPKVRRAIAEEYNIFRTVPQDVDLFSSASQQNAEQQKQHQQQPNQVTIYTARDFVLHLCPYCLEPELDHSSIIFHLVSCLRRPPGREVYRDPSKKIIVFECDGAIHSHFAKNLALVSKAFLEHKSLDYDMTPFVFYVVCTYEEFSEEEQNDDDDDDDDDDDSSLNKRNGDQGITSSGCRITSYFSREKQNGNNYNLSCILTLPQFQSKGYGRFMIDMSYEMSRREGKVGSPEKPLSDFGERMYRVVWKERVLDVLANWTPVMENIQYLPHLAKQYGLLTGKQQQQVQQQNAAGTAGTNAAGNNAAISTGMSAGANSSLSNTSTNILAAFNSSSSNNSTSATPSSSGISIEALMYATGMIKQDVTQALQDLKVMDFMRNYSSNSNANNNNSSNNTFRVINIDPEVLKNHLKTKIKRQERGYATFESALFHWFPQWYASSKSYNDAVTTLNGGSRFSAFAAALPSNQDFRVAENIIIGIITAGENNSNHNEQSTSLRNKTKIKIERNCDDSDHNNTTKKIEAKNKKSKKESAGNSTAKNKSKDGARKGVTSSKSSKKQQDATSKSRIEEGTKRHSDTKRRQRE